MGSNSFSHTVSDSLTFLLTQKPRNVSWSARSIWQQRGWIEGLPHVCAQLWCPILSNKGGACIFYFSTMSHNWVAETINVEGGIQAVERDKLSGVIFSFLSELWWPCPVTDKLLRPLSVSLLLLDPMLHSVTTHQQYWETILLARYFLFSRCHSIVVQFR